MKRLFDAQKAGHAGTLDPLATGILPIAFGEATKTVSYVDGRRKVYRFTVRWGGETDTDDAEGKVPRPRDAPCREAISKPRCPAFTGDDHADAAALFRHQGRWRARL